MTISSAASQQVALEPVVTATTRASFMNWGSIFAGAFVAATSFFYRHRIRHRDWTGGLVGFPDLA